MRISAIEIGTNSTKFIIAETFKDKSFNVVEKCSTVNRLSRDMYDNNRISEDSICKAMDIIGDYIKKSKENDAVLLCVFSTSVLRDASNREDFIGRVKSLYGIGIEVISGEREAFLSYKACSSLVKNNRRFAVIDIGGGSTEISIGSKTSIERNISIDIGAVRLTELFVKNDPATYEELKNVLKYLTNKLMEVDLNDLRGVDLIGTGGTIKSVSTIFGKLDYKNEDEIHGSTIMFDDIGYIYNFLSQLCIADKRNLVGLNPKRADVIVAGTAVLFMLMKKYHIEKITVSSRGVIEGFLQDYLHTDNELGSERGSLYGTD